MDEQVAERKLSQKVVLRVTNDGKLCRAINAFILKGYNKVRFPKKLSKHLFGRAIISTNLLARQKFAYIMKLKR